MIEAIDHINLVVSDLEASLRFYTELLGFKITRRARLEGKWIDSIVGLKDVKADVVYITAPAGEPRLELLAYESPKGVPHPPNSKPNTPGLRHLALRVRDIRALCGRLETAHVNIISEPVTVPSGVVEHAEGKKTLCYFLDPDGTLLELAEYSKA